MALDVLLPIFVFLFNGCPFNVCYVANILFITLPSFLLLPQAAKSIQHQAAYNAAKHYLKEDEEDHIIAKSDDFKAVTTTSNSC